ncbi:UDP-N-acetylmuramate dehydrogenase [Compostibacter hankyongensis]|uniref:UDP-N-acetylenolpyruvoylglucosamine reductase n=1 Tax=Compostibacter hankyongensis TaxID=1007089 RepID=A0ABP8G8M4_9BACT
MRVLDRLDLTAYNSYGVCAVCAKAFFPDSEADIRELYRSRPDVPKVLLGSGHNVILSRQFYEQDFVIFSGNFDSVEIGGDTIVSEAGALMEDLSIVAMNKSLSGLEIFYDIPSSLGGAVVMNAGAGGEEIKDLLLAVRYYDTLSDEFKEIAREEMDFEYRNSFFQRNPQMIVLKAMLRLIPGNKQDILEKMNRIKAQRSAKQPKEFPNAGSVFKRPPGRYVGPMIEELGLKGFSLGGARVSEKHGGFVVNFNRACGADIVNLITEIRARVRERYNVELEIEQRII